MLVIVLLKEEFGLQVRNSTVDDSTLEGNITSQTEQEESCPLTPTLPILGMCALGLEIAKTCFGILKDILKLRRQRKVNPIEGIKKKRHFQADLDMKRNSKAQSFPTSCMKRAETFPKISVPALETSRRRSSGVNLETIIKIAPFQMLERTQENPVEDETFQIIKKNLRTSFLRSNLIMTIFLLICVVVTSVNLLLNKFEVSVNTALARLVYYCLAVHIFVLDPAILSFSLNKLNLKS